MCGGDPSKICNASLRGGEVLESVLRTALVSDELSDCIIGSGEVFIVALAGGGGGGFSCEWAASSSSTGLTVFESITYFAVASCRDCASSVDEASTLDCINLSLNAMKISVMVAITASSS